MTFEIDRDIFLTIPETIQDASSTAFLEELDAIIARSPAAIRIDCASVDRATSAHIGLLWAAQCRCQAAGAALVLVTVSPMTRRILQVLDLAELFTYEGLPVTEMSNPSGRIRLQGLQSHRQRFPVSVHAARLALRRMDSFLEGAALPSIAVLDIQTIAYELLQNIVSYSGASTSDDIQMEVDYDPIRVRLMISDPGRPFDPTSQPDDADLMKAATERRTHGFGLLLIRRLADVIQYERRNDRNVVSIIKKVG